MQQINLTFRFLLDTEGDIRAIKHCDLITRKNFMSGCRENSGLPLLVQECITYHQHTFDLGVNPAEILYLEGLAPQRMRRLKQGLKQRNVLCLIKWGNQIPHFMNSGQFLNAPLCTFSPSNIVQMSTINTFLLSHLSPSAF